VNNNGGVNSNGNNVNNDNNAVRPAWPYRPMFVPCGANLCRLFSVCLHKAKEPYSLSRRGVMEKQSAEKHIPPEQPDANGASGSASPAGRFRFF
jgi:hypothetical protein